MSDSDSEREEVKFFIFLIIGGTSRRLSPVFLFLI